MPTADIRKRVQKRNKFHKNLDANMKEWQWVITQARKRKISEEDMD